MANNKKKTKKPMSRGKKIAIIVVEVLIVIAVIVGLYLWTKVSRIDFQDVGEIKTNELVEETKEVIDNYTTIALFGVDNRSNGNLDSGNSDSIMIASINNETKEVKIVSVYRDTYLASGDNNVFRKANYAFSRGGAKEAVEMLNRNLDLKIDKYVTVDFYALAAAVDAVGGIDVELTSEEASYMNGGETNYIYYTSLVVGKPARQVSAGAQTLDGVQAVAYCRIRYTAGGDYRRAERQRYVVQQLVEKSKNLSITQINDLINALFDSVGTNIGLTEMIAMAADAKNYTLAEMGGFPSSWVATTLGAAGSVNVPCTLETNVKTLHSFLYVNEEYTPSNTVEELSSMIETQTGFHEDSAKDYGY